MNLLDGNFSYTFPSIRGIQAKREYYVVMCPLKLIPKIFLNDLEELPPEYRAQRVLNKSRVPVISKYIEENPNDYVFSSLTASIDGDFEFIPFNNHDSTFQNIGKLIVSMDSRFLINDGQHRRAAIEKALQKNPDLANETISIVFFSDRGLKRSQQMFADLNKHAVNTTKSIGILFDHRDPMRNLTIELIETIPLLRDFTDKESNSLSKFSSKIFLLSNLYDVNCRLLSKNKNNKILKKDKEFAYDFWAILCSTIKEWNDVKNKNISAKELRENYLHSHGVILGALGIVGNYFYPENKEGLKKYFPKLNNINWSRQNLTDWQERAIRANGRISKSDPCIAQCSILIKQKLGIELSQTELKLEQKFIETQRRNKNVN